MRRMAVRFTHRRTRGFSLIELMITLTIIVLMVAMSQIGFLRLRQQGTARNGMRHLTSILNEARNSALLLGAAAGTQRVRLAPVGAGTRGCPDAFTDDNAGNGLARVGIQVVFGAGTPADPSLVTFVSRVERTITVLDPAFPAGLIVPAPRVPLQVYELHCTTVDFTDVYRGDVNFVAEESVPRNPPGNVYTVTYDSRGFVLNTGGPQQAAGGRVASIAMRETRGRRHLQRVLAMPSGYACLERDNTVARGRGRCQ